MGFLKKAWLVLSVVLAILGGLAQALPLVLAPESKPMGVKWRAAVDSEPPRLMATIGTGGSFNVVLAVRTVHQPTAGGFTARTPLRRDTLVVGDITKGLTSGDTTRWTMRIYRSRAVAQCARGTLPRPGFCWSASAETLIVMPAPGATKVLLDDWSVVSSAEESDNQRDAEARWWIRLAGVILIAVAMPGTVVAAVTAAGAIKRARAMDKTQYVEGIIASMQGPKASLEQRKTIARWTFMDGVLYEDALAKIQEEYRPTRDDKASIWHSSAIDEFREKHDAIVKLVNDELEKTRLAAVAFAKREKEEAEAAAEAAKTGGEAGGSPTKPPEQPRHD